MDFGTKSLTESRMQNKSPYKKGGLFAGALPTVFARAKALRNRMTYAEEVLWSHLKKGVEGCRFRRQHPIGSFIADFYCYQAKLVVEVDGSIHQQMEVRKNDEQKEFFFVNSGHSLLRFTNQQVLSEIEEVLQTIRTVVLLHTKNNSADCGD